MPLLIDVYNVLHTTGILPPDLAGIGLADLKRLIAISRYRSEQCRLVCDGVAPVTSDLSGAHAPLRRAAGAPSDRAGSFESDEYRVVYESRSDGSRSKRRRWQPDHSAVGRSQTSSDARAGWDAAPHDQTKDHLHTRGKRKRNRDEHHITRDRDGVFYVDDRFPHLQVTWSGSGVEADTVIERLIRNSSAPRLLTVVSSDRRIIRAAKKRRSRPLTSDQFLMQLVADFSGLLTSTDRPLQAYEIPLDRASVEWWQRYMGLDTGSRHGNHIPAAPDHLLHDDDEAAAQSDCGPDHSVAGSERPADPTPDMESETSATAVPMSADAIHEQQPPRDHLTEAEHLVRHWIDEHPEAKAKLNDLFRRCRTSRDAGASTKSPYATDSSNRSNRNDGSMRGTPDHRGGENTGGGGSRSGPPGGKSRTGGRGSSAASSDTEWWLQYFDVDPESFQDGVDHVGGDAE
ncbi:MAG: hypothetical protein ACOC0P_03785 [Planctomycetota bacterium]